MISTGQPKLGFFDASRSKTGVMRIALTAMLLMLAACATQQRGRWVEDSRTDCLVWSEASGSMHQLTWSGDCVNGKAIGPGKVVMHFWHDDAWNTQVFEGQFVEGKASGKGTFTEPGVSRTEAYFVDGRVKGPISYLGVDGTRYEGEADYQEAGNSSYLVPAGQGVLVLPGGDRYEGEFLAGLPNGHGRWDFKDGSTYEGDVLDKQPHGFGTFVGTDGSRYEGQLWYGLPHGEGRFTLTDGTFFEGELFEGKMHGDGVLSWTNGDRMNARFSDGRLVGGVLRLKSGARYEISSEDLDSNRVRITAEDGFSAVGRLRGPTGPTLDYCESEEISKELCTLVLALFLLSKEWDSD